MTMMMINHWPMDGCLYIAAHDESSNFLTTHIGQ